VKYELRYLYEDRDRHGNIRLYARRNGRKIRIRERWGTPEFLDAYRNALEQTELPKFNPARFGAAAQRGSLRWLVEQYYGSAEFKQLDARTQHVRRGILNRLCDKHGSKPYAQMEPRHVRKLRDDKADLPEAANALLKAVRQVFSWSVEAGYCGRNAAAGVPYIRTNTEGWHAWTREEVQQYLRHHGKQSRAGRALTFILFTGAARSDVVKLGRQHCRNGHIVYKREKTGVEVDIPILPDLQLAIDSTPKGQLTFIVTQFGKPFTADGFGNRMRDWCDQAGLPHCSAHGLRKAGATIAADNGATTHQLMAIFGWKTVKQAELYTRSANRKHLAGNAMHFIALEQNENEIDPPCVVVRKGGPKSGPK
jgi:integrase